MGRCTEGQTGAPCSTSSSYNAAVAVTSSSTLAVAITASGHASAYVDTNRRLYIFGACVSGTCPSSSPSSSPWSPRQATRVSNVQGVAGGDGAIAVVVDSLSTVTLSPAVATIAARMDVTGAVTLGSLSATRSGTTASAYLPAFATVRAVALAADGTACGALATSLLPAGYIAVSASVLSGRTMTVAWPTGTVGAVSFAVGDVVGNLLAAVTASGSNGPFAFLLQLDNVDNALTPATASYALVQLSVQLPSTVPPPVIAPASAVTATAIPPSAPLSTSYAVTLTTSSSTFYTVWYSLTSAATLPATTRTLPTCNASTVTSTSLYSTTTRPVPPTGWSLLCTRAFDNTGTGSNVSSAVYVALPSNGTIAVQPNGTAHAGRASDAAVTYRRVVVVGAGVAWSINSATVPQWVTAVSPSKGTGPSYVDVTLSPAAAATAAASLSDSASLPVVTLTSGIEFVVGGGGGASATLVATMALQQANVAVTPTSLKHFLSVGSSVNTTVTLADTAVPAAQKYVSVTTDSRWASVVGGAALQLLPAGGTLTITVTATTGGLLPGTYNGNILIQTRSE